MYTPWCFHVLCIMCLCDGSGYSNPSMFVELPGQSLLLAAIIAFVVSAVLCLFYCLHMYQTFAR